TEPPRPTVLSIARIQSGPRRSPACIPALRGTASNARAPWTDAKCLADTVRIRGRRGFPESGARRAGIHATLRPSALRRRALRYHSPAPAPQPDSNGIARPLNTIYILPRRDAAVLRPYKYADERRVLQLKIAQRCKFTAYDQGRIRQPGMPQEPRGQRGDDGYSCSPRLRTDAARRSSGNSGRQYVQLY